ncbi:hypothetical protein WR25_00457 [Diploscapter pachys]|uniref:Uncharacterized protein n=1 Tax=Diploscapter pachys TaxID=2018661 RepID=A0A2A2IZZ2_9BILA|nr:hypothetical protein WR25_00457 [Diploscapter pachys]
MFYYDERAHTCFAYPIECDASLQVFQILYETEEECTLSNMGSRSDICNSDESCYTTDNFGWCCSNIAFEGDGAETGKFNYTGIGGEGIHTYEKASTDMPLIAPVDCNEDGMRSGVEVSNIL